MGREEDELDDREWPDEADVDDSDDPPVVPCPYCRKEISEEAAACPHCGSYISREDAPSRRSLWVVVATAVVLFTLLVLLILRR